jgi:signal transduction histidine kinase/ActR/RegA family two-component response regulator
MRSPRNETARHGAPAASKLRTRPSWRDLSIRTKLVLAITLTSAISLLLASTGFVGYRVAAFRGDLVRDLDALARISGDNSAAALTFRDPRSAEQVLSALRAKPHIVSAVLYTPGGAVFASYPAGGRDDAGAPPGPDGSRFEASRVRLTRRIALDGEAVGTIVLTSDLEELGALVARSLNLVALLLLVSISLALALSYRFQRTVSGPVQRMADAAREVAETKNYSVRVAREGNDELGFLASAFNEMLSLIESRDEELRRARDELETRVEIRTGELIREMEDREVAEEALRERDAQLRQSQKMEAVGLLAGGVAHDFNNLLTAIVGYSQLMLRSIDPGDPLHSNAEEVLKAGQRATALTRQLLAFSRKQVLEPRVLDLNDVVSNLQKMLRRLIGEDVELESRPAPGLGSVMADPGQLEQVVMNLAVNARDAMPQGGRLAIETANVDLDDAFADLHPGVQPGPHVLLAIRDNGCGMDAATSSRIFEPFFTTKEQGRGTGLGLSTVYGIVKQSGGTIWVESEPGRGTTFRIYLPRVEAPAERVAAAQPRELPRGTETVLLVEDDDSVRDLAADILRLNGYTVLAAPHGIEALELCARRTERIDLVLSDVVMPHLNGPELLERLRPLLPEAKVLLMSGYAGDALGQHGTLDPGTPFLAKPFTPDTLARKIREVLERPPACIPPEARSRRSGTI